MAQLCGIQYLPQPARAYPYCPSQLKMLVYFTAMARKYYLIHMLYQ